MFMTLAPAVATPGGVGVFPGPARVQLRAGPACNARVTNREKLRWQRLPRGPVLLADPLSGLLSPAAMLLLSGALVSGPYALITTAVSADLVST